jgi:hypothetical protein
MAAEIAPEAVQLDTTKLAAISEEPQQQLYVLNFLTTIERLVERLDADGASAYQLFVQKELLRVIQLTAPAPTRLIRNVAGRCFSGVFGKGDRKLLYDTINELLGIINAGKDKDIRVKHAAVHCVGEIFETAGDSAISVATFTCSSLLKLLKNSSNNCGLRSAIFRALGKVFFLVGGMADESNARDTWKAARNAASGDKAAVVQASALQVDINSTLFPSHVLVINLTMENPVVSRIYALKRTLLLFASRLREAPGLNFKGVRLSIHTCTKGCSLVSGLLTCASVFH